MNSYANPDPNNSTVQSQLSINRPTYNYNNGIKNEQQKFSVSNNWFDKSDSQPEQINNVQYTFINQDIDNRKSDNIVETEDNFWADVENREILPPESFQNDSLQAAMNNLQISNEVSNKMVLFNSLK